VLSLAGVETEAEADGAGPPLSEGEPPPAPVDAELAGPPEGPAPETIAAGDRPELGRRRRGETLATRREAGGNGCWRGGERRGRRGGHGEERGETGLTNFYFFSRSPFWVLV